MFLTIDHLGLPKRLALHALGYRKFMCSFKPYDVADGLARWDIINHLISKSDSESIRYLEIGCFKNECFSKVDAGFKIGVDPTSGGTFRGTSEQFFESNAVKFDVIFVDGDHSCSSIKFDIESALNNLAADGVVVVHDMIPTNEFEALPLRRSRSWCGEGWRILPSLMRLSDDKILDVQLVAVDHGIAVIKVGSEYHNFSGLDTCELDFFDSVISRIPDWCEGDDLSVLRK